MPRLGIIGGTFDPLHLGHIQMGEYAKEELNLDRVIFMPGGNPPHKNNVTDKKLRYEMTQIGLDGKFEVSDYEIKKETFSYTYETLLRFCEEGELYFILGADSLDYIDSWYKPDEIFKLAKVVVFARDDFDIRKKVNEIKDRFNARVIVINKPITDISSTKIRLLADMDLDYSMYLPKPLAEYIKKNNVYQGYYSDLRAKVKESEKTSRFIHTLGVCKQAVRMAEVFGADIEKTYIASLLHDCAKHIPADEMYRMCKENNVYLDEFELKNPPLVHAKLGAFLAKNKYGIQDEEIIDAIRWHTLGKKNMSVLAKVVFVADMAEEGRSFKWVKNLRTESLRNLDKAVYLCVDSTIKFNEERNNPVHKNAYELREEFSKFNT